MLTWSQLEAQTLTLRARISDLLGTMESRADEMPPTWNNNARWHAGHLVVTPRLLLFGLAGEPLGLDENYRKWFAKGTGPREWGSDPVPSFAQLRKELIDFTDPLFDTFKERQDLPFAKPYLTSAGITLNSAAESLVFSQSHDAIHLGLLLALKRALGV